jgi:predicted transcriptional regulator
VIKKSQDNIKGMTKMERDQLFGAAYVKVFCDFLNRTVEDFDDRGYISYVTLYDHVK